MTVTLRSAVRCNATMRATIPRRTNFPKVQTARVARPEGLKSEFTGSSMMKSLTASFAGLVVSPLRKALSGVGRQTLVVEANNKKGLGCTLHGTRRKRARVSGFRVRMSTVGGRKVLKARRVKGRKRLTPGGRPIRK